MATQTIPPFEKTVKFRDEVPMETRAIITHNARKALEIIELNNRTGQKTEPFVFEHLRKLVRSLEDDTTK